MFYRVQPSVFEAEQHRLSEEAKVALTQDLISKLGVVPETPRSEVIRRLSGYYFTAVRIELAKNLTDTSVSDALKEILDDLVK